MRTSHKTMLDWIVMDVVQILLEIFFVRHDMFPESSLPEAAFPMFTTRFRATFGQFSTLTNRSRKENLHPSNPT